MEQKIEKELTVKPYTSAIPFGDLSDKDLYWLTIACDVGYTKHSAGDVLNELAGGYAQLRRIHAAGGVEGIVIARIATHPSGREYVLDCLAGKNIIKCIRHNAADIGKEFKALAKAHNCAFISAGANNKVMERLYATVIQPNYKQVKIIAEV